MAALADAKARVRALAEPVTNLVARDPLRALAYVILPLAAVPRLWQMIADQGVFWPDEIFQSLEQAHRFAFGYGWTPWEFRDGARSWIFPGLLGIVLKVASWLGLTKSGVGVVMTARSVMLALTLAGVWATVRIGQKVGGTLGALLAGTLIALCPPLLVYGTRCMTEVASGPLLALAAVLCMEGTWRRALAAGALASLAIFFRFQNGLFAVGFFFLLLFNRHWKGALAYAGAGLVGGFLGGLVDKLVWGRFFHSFLVYWKFNVTEGQASRWGVDSFDYYFQVVTHSFGPALVLILLGFLLSFRHARILPLLCIGNVLVHAYIPHKEYRFIMPMVPIALGLSGGGLGWALGGVGTAPKRFWAALQRARFAYGGWVATGLAISLGVLLARKTQTMTFADMGSFRGGKEDGWAPWNHEAGPNYAYWEAGKHDDLCGIITVGTPLISAGGYSYLHRNVPMLGSLTSSDLAACNYIAAPHLTVPPSGYSVVKSFSIHVPTFERSDGKTMPPPDYDYVLFRRDGTCTPPPPWWTPNFP